MENNMPQTDPNIIKKYIDDMFVIFWSNISEHRKVEAQYSKSELMHLVLSGFDAGILIGKEIVMDEVIKMSPPIPPPTKDI